MMFPKLSLLLGLAASTNACGSSKSYKPEGCTGAEWAAEGRCRKIADEMVRLQHSSGGWPKCIYPIGPDGSDNGTPDGRGTLDNGASVWEIRFLAYAYFATGKASSGYRKAAIKGIDYVFNAEHTNGGWPQYWPLGGGLSYQDAITFNDGLHLNAMDLMQDIASRKYPFNKNPFKNKYKSRAGATLTRGLKVILDTQIDDRQWAGGSCPRKIGWSAQHDRNTLAPADGRDFEPASYSGNEGLGLAKYLMKQSNPSQAIKDAVLGAWVFTKRYVIEGCEVDKVNGDKVMKKCSQSCPDRWPRFADLDQTRPIFCDRGCTEDSSLEYNDVPDGFNEVKEERRNGYQYSGEDWGKNFLLEFNNWKTRADVGVSDPSSSCVNRGSGAALTCSSGGSGGSGGSGNCPGECFDRCEKEYGGDIKDQGDAYSCAKGCATMEDGEVDDPSKFCDKDEDDRYDDCNKSCDKSSSNSSRVKKCRFGCEFWCSKGCIDRCTKRYGGNGLTGDSYYCAKGCAGMKDNKLDDPSKFCDKDEDDRYDDCNKSCDKSSSNSSRVKKCEYGCEYWK